MKLLTMALFGLAAAGAGAGGTVVAEKVYWDNELKVQMAGRDKMIADLNADLTKLRSGLGDLRNTNTKMRALITSALQQTDDIAVSGRNTLEKLRAIIIGLEQLQKALAAVEAAP